MTTNEIKTLIQNTIAGQGSQVDIGGKLAEILVSIVDAMPSGETPRPIVLTDEPATNDTVETLAAKGLTLDEIQAAAQGLRTGVVIEDIFYNLVFANYESSELFTLVFGMNTFRSNGELRSLTQYYIEKYEGSEQLVQIDEA